MTDQTILHYKILEKLGEGGMGVVYKARDTKLDRDVALKFLPARVHGEEEEKARFLQEAKAAATLNHPNICIIHDIMEDNGKSFIVMELVDGMTLREKFHRTPVPVKEAVQYAIQIGEALEEAHGKNIVHRDIKSDNIMVNRKNQIKVMDFGLAKLKGSLKLTKAASTIGTLGYMAPEQIQGGEADARSDLFSFGVVLFEMLTGKLPFRGEHEAAMVYSIVNEEPEQLQKLLPDAPAELAHIISTALEKDSDERYQTAAELTRELRRLLKQSSRVSRAALSSATMPVAEAGHPEVKSFPRSKTMLSTFIVIGAVIAIAAAVFFFMPKSGKNEQAVVGTLNPNMMLHVLPIPFTQISYPGLSRDGNWVAFPAADAGSKWDVYYMHVSGNNVRRLTNDSVANGNNLSADISPDGSQVAYSVSDAEGNTNIRLISSVGGLSTTLVKNAILPRWRPDGQRIGYVVLGNSRPVYSLWSMKPDGSDKRLDFADSLGTSGRFSFNWSPDGKSVAWIRSFKEGYQEIITHDLETGKERQLTNEGKNEDDVAWTSAGVVVYSSNKGGNSNLWMVPLAGGVSQQLTKGSGPDIGISASADNQKLIYLQQQRIGHVWSASLTTLASRQMTFDDRLISGVALSPDGKKLAIVMGDIDPLKPGLNLYMQDLDGSNRRQLTIGDEVVANPAWSPDGKWISYSSVPAYAPADSGKMYLLDPGNPGTPRMLANGLRSLWIDEGRIVVRRVKSSNGDRRPLDELVSLDGSSMDQPFGDSTMAVSIGADNAIIYRDFRENSKGLWAVPQDFLKKPSGYKPKKVPIPEGTVIAQNQRYVYTVNSLEELWRQEPQTGTKKKIQSSFPGLDANSIGAVSKDDATFVYVTFQLSGKLVMIENIFK